MMRKLLLITLFAVPFIQLNAQNQAEVDSLKDLLRQNLPEKDKVAAYVGLAKAYSDVDSAQTVQFVLKAISLAQKIGYVEGQIDANCEVANMLLKKRYSLQADSLFHLIIEESDRAAYSLGIGRGYLGKGTIANRKSKYEDAIPLFLQAKEAFNKARNHIGIASTYNQLGTSFYRLGLNDSAIHYHTVGLMLAQENDNKKAIGTFYSNLGLIEAVRGNYKKALEMHLGALEIFEEMGWERSILIANLNIGMSYYDQQDYEMSLKYLLTSLEGAEKINANRIVSAALANIADNYKRQKKYIEALKYYRRSLSKDQELGDEYGMGVTQNTIGQTLLYMKDFEQAKKYLTSAFEASIRLNTLTLKCQTLTLLGEVEYELGNYKKAEEYLLEGIELAKSLKQSTEVGDGSEILSKVYEATGNYYRSLVYFKDYHMHYDSLLGQEKTRQISQLQIQFETEKKEQEIASLNQASKIQGLEIKQKNQNLLLLGILVLVLLLTAAAIYFFLQKKQLAIKQKAQDMEQKLLRTQMNPHFIFNAMSAIQEYMVLGDAVNANQYLSKFSRLIRQVLDNSRNEFISLENEVHMLENYILIHNAWRPKPISYSIEVDPAIEVEEYQIPPMFAQPFVENALEHGHLDQEGAEIKISFQLKEDMLSLTISDNGVGLPSKAEVKIPGHISHATKITQERISLYKSMGVEKISFDIKSLSPGTRVIFSLPYQYT